MFGRYTRSIRRGIKSCFCAVLITAATLAMAGDRVADATIPAQVARMSVWVGRWQSHTTFMDTPYSKAGVMSAEMTCSWSPNHGFVLCDHLLHGPDGVITNSISLYTYDENAGVYKFYGVQKDESPREVPMVVKGNTWSFGTRVESQDKTILFLTNDKFISPTTMQFHTEFSDDNGLHWKELNQGSLTKIG